MEVRTFTKYIEFHLSKYSNINKLKKVQRTEEQ